MLYLLVAVSKQGQGGASKFAMVVMIMIRSSWSSSRLQHGGRGCKYIGSGKAWVTQLHSPVCIFHNLKISNIPPYMQIEERPPTRFRPFRENESREKVSSKIFLPLPSVPFDLNPDKESLAKPSNFCQKPRGFKQTAETGRRLLCKLKLPINFEPTHSLTHVPSKRKVIRGSVCSQITFSPKTCHWASFDSSTAFLSSLRSPPRLSFLTLSMLQAYSSQVTGLKVDLSRF